jgi:predicted hydrocarbon binding protein
MPSTLTPPRLALGTATLDQLRIVLERELPDQAATLIREIGFSAGAAAYEGFVESVSQRYGIETPQALDTRYLGEALAGFFREAGWGSAVVDTVAPGLLALDSPDWTEAVARGAAAPSCHFSAGMLSDFFTRLGGYPAAVMEVECRCRGDARCRFLVGSSDLLTWVYEGMVAGNSADQLIATLRDQPGAR